MTDNRMSFALHKITSEHNKKGAPEMSGAPLYIFAKMIKFPNHVPV